MDNNIKVQVEKQNRGSWIKVFIPFNSKEEMKAIIQNENGEILRIVQLVQGNNSIDISNINTLQLNIKIETSYQTVFKKINL